MSVGVYSVRGFVNWLEKQDLATKYDYTLSNQCIVANYLKDMTGRRNSVPIHKLEEWGLYEIASSHYANSIHKNIPGNVEGPIHTYGQALQRAKYHLALAA